MLYRNSRVLTCLAVLAACAFSRAEEPKLLSQLEAHHEWVHAQVTPAVVAIECRADSSGNGFYGAGVVVSPDGLILTASTVVPAGASSVQAYFADGSVLNADVV